MIRRAGEEIQRNVVFFNGNNTIKLEYLTQGKTRAIKKWSHQIKVTGRHLHLMSFASICNERFLRHVNFSYSNGKSQHCRHKLPKYRANVVENAEQGNLGDSKRLWLFHDVTKSSKSETKCIKAVEITSNDESSVVCNWSTIGRCDNSQYEYCKVDCQGCEV